MKLADWARKQGLDYKTAYRLYRSGNFPRPTEQLLTGTILVHEIPTKTNNAVLYARVSSSDQTNDLEHQLQRLRDYAAKQGLTVIKEVTEIGSGLNGHRNQLLKVLKNPSASIIVVEYKDRLTRFGFEYLASALESSGRKILVINQTENTTDLVQDMIDILTSFCARLYGQRSARNRAKRAMEAAKC